MQIYTRYGFVWAKGQGTPKEVMDFLNYACSDERDMVDSEIYGEPYEDNEE
jgi:hypothetical protein